jgi:hypothetical protein
MAAGMILGGTAGFGVGVCGVSCRGILLAAGLAVGSGAAILSIFGAEFGVFAFAAVAGRVLSVFTAAALAVLSVATSGGGLLVLRVFVAAGHVLGVFAFTTGHGLGAAIFTVATTGSGLFRRGRGLGGGGLLSDSGQPSRDEQNKKYSNQSEFHLYDLKFLGWFLVWETRPTRTDRFCEPDGKERLVSEAEDGEERKRENRGSVGETGGKLR